MGKVNSVTVTSSNIFHFSIQLLYLGETAVHTEKRHWLFQEGSQRLPTRPTMKRWVWEVKMKCFVTTVFYNNIFVAPFMQRQDLGSNIVPERYTQNFWLHKCLCSHHTSRKIWQWFYNFLKH